MSFVFKNMTYPLMELGLVDVVDIYHDLEASDISETIPNQFFLIYNMCHVCFCHASTGCLRRR